jgi:hypothetical protein
MGEDKSQKQTKGEAFADAQRKALERVVVHIKSETKIKNMALEKDIVEAYSQANVKIQVTYAGGLIKIRGDDGFTGVKISDLSYLDGFTISPVVNILGP